MRSVITLSVPAALAKDIRSSAKRRGTSVSAFMVESYQIRENLISEEEILADVAEAAKEDAAGKTYSGLDKLMEVVNAK